MTFSSCASEKIIYFGKRVTLSVEAEHVKNHVGSSQKHIKYEYTTAMAGVRATFLDPSPSVVS